MDVGEIHNLAVYEVDKTSGGGHDNLDAAAQGADLALDGRAAVDGEHLQVRGIFGHVLEVGGNLEAELAGGGEDECLGHTALSVNALYDGEAEGGCLARAGLRQSHDIVALGAQQQRDNLLLHGHGVLETKFLDGAEQVVSHAKVFK